MPSISSRVTDSSIVAFLLIDLIVVLKEDSIESSKRKGPKALVVLLLDLVINRLKLVVSNLTLLLIGSSLEIVEKTITSFYSKGLLSYYRKSSLV